MADWTIQPLDRRHDRTAFTSGREALERASGLSDKLGVWAVEVVAIDAAAVAFYRKYGFTPLLDSPRHLFLPIETVRKVLA